MFIKVKTEDRGGARRSVTLRVNKITRIREHNGQAIITQEGEDYEVWTLETKPEVDELIRRSGTDITELY